MSGLGACSSVSTSTGLLLAPASSFRPACSLPLRSLNDVERAFSKHVRSPQDLEEGMALAHQLEVQQGVIENLANFASDADPAVYLDTYERLASWVDNSLDMYRVRGGVGRGRAAVGVGVWGVGGRRGVGRESGVGQDGPGGGGEGGRRRCVCVGGGRTCGCQAQ